MKTIMKIGYTVVGLFHLDEKNRNILKVEVINDIGLEINFPDSTSKNFNYLKLENIMKYYMKLEDNKTLTDVIDRIIKDGFFYPLKPALKIEVERLEN